MWLLLDICILKRTGVFDGKKKKSPSSPLFLSLPLTLTLFHLSLTQFLDWSSCFKVSVVSKSFKERRVYARGKRRREKGEGQKKKKEEKGICIYIYIHEWRPRRARTLPPFVLPLFLSSHSLCYRRFIYLFIFFFFYINRVSSGLLNANGIHIRLLLPRVIIPGIVRSEMSARGR